jgi:O-antigen/teichoic acid export membrane protein
LGAFIIAICGRGWSSELENTFFIGLALVPIWALLWIRCSVARAFGGIVSALAPERIARDGLLLCLLGIGYIGLGRNFDAPLTMSALLVSSAAALGLVSVAARRLASDELVDVAPMYAGRIWLRAAMPLVLIGTVEPLLNRSGVILLGWHGSVTDAGIYAMAFNVAFLVVLPRTSVNALFAPAAADLFARNDREKLQALITRTAVWTLVSALCIAIPLSLVAQPILGWFGRGFDAGAMALRILLFGQVASAGAGSQLYLMTMTGHERRAALLLALSAAANVIIGIVFVRELGLIGAAISTTATLVAWNVAMGWFIWRNLQLVPGVLGLYSSLAAPRKRQMRKHGGMTGADIVHLASGESPNDRRVG